MARRADGKQFEPEAVEIPDAAPVAVAWTACAMAYAIEVLAYGQPDDRARADAYLTDAKAELERNGWRLVSHLQEAPRAWRLEPTVSAVRVQQ